MRLGGWKWGDGGVHDRSWGKVFGRWWWPVLLRLNPFQTSQGAKSDTLSIFKHTQTDSKCKSKLNWNGTNADSVKKIELSAEQINILFTSKWPLAASLCLREKVWGHLCFSGLSPTFFVALYRIKMHYSLYILYYTLYQFSKPSRGVTGKSNSLKSLYYMMTDRGRTVKWVIRCSYLNNHITITNHAD